MENDLVQKRVPLYTRGIPASFPRYPLAFSQAEWQAGQYGVSTWTRQGGQEIMEKPLQFALMNPRHSCGSASFGLCVLNTVVFNRMEGLPELSTIEVFPLEPLARICLHSP
jgi:hypothetical protein